MWRHSPLRPADASGLMRRSSLFNVMPHSMQVASLQPHLFCGVDSSCYFGGSPVYPSICVWLMWCWVCVFDYVWLVGCKKKGYAFSYYIKGDEGKNKLTQKKEKKKKKIKDKKN